MKAKSNASFLAPLCCWDFFTLHFAQVAAEGRRKVERDILEGYRDKNYWRSDLEEILNRPYEALVLTDAKVMIEWVSEGFTKMTGYSKTEVIGKSPNILHGENTSVSSKDRVRKKLFDHGIFTEDLVNYRKNGEEYICRVEIHPIYTTSNALTHYLALEKEIV